MLWFRRYRLPLLVLAMTHLLFMQVALAQYACPGMGAPEAMPTQTHLAAHADCPDAAQADRAALCMAHCQAAGASPGAHQVPTLAPPPWGDGAAFGAAAWTIELNNPARPLEPPRSGSPPPRIRHCCLRI